MSFKPTKNIEAYDAYLRGQKLFNSGIYNQPANEFESSIEWLEKAVALDPKFTIAYTALAVAHLRSYAGGTDRTEERLQKVRVALNKASELDPNSNDVKLALGYYYYRGLQDYQRALETFQEVQKARPNSLSPFIGYIQRRQGKWDESIASLKEALKLNPRFQKTLLKALSMF